MASSEPRPLFVVLGNQLFPFAHLQAHRDDPFFMAEDLGLCTYVRHHRQKIVLFLAAMRSYRDELRGNGCTVHYEQLDETASPGDRSYEEKLGQCVDDEGITHVRLWEVADRFFEERLVAFAEERGLELEFLPSPMFLTPRATFEAYLDGTRRPLMADFYRQQRRRLGLLLDDDGSPRGGRWSYDDENRKKLPADVPVPGNRPAGVTEHVRELIPFVNETFSGHPGALDEDGWWLPTTRRQALANLRSFLSERFEDFGDYEDALSTRDPFLFHSVLTPALNLGLVTPDEVIERAVEHAGASDIPLNSLEGFVRQIIGWREFIHGIYRRYDEEQSGRNFFDHERRLTEHWYDGTTGLVPLDDVIAKAQRWGWTHHIERLMVAGNLMVLCEIAPKEAWRWFMEMHVDSADWVMGPNVYGMGIFSDGGIFSTKPYICGSNYVLKMSDYRKPKEPTLFGETATWCDVMDGLYWRFVDRQRAYLGRNPRLARMVGTLDRMDAERRERLSAAAEAFLARVTRT